MLRELLPRVTSCILLNTKTKLFTDVEVCLYVKWLCFLATECLQVLFLCSSWMVIGIEEVMFI